MYFFVKLLKISRTAMKNLISSILLIGLIIPAIGQPGWNWPEDGETLEIAKEKQAFYKVSMGLEDWEKAYDAIQWLHINNPDLNPSIYIDGAKIITQLLKVEEDQGRKKRLEDSLLLTYDLRAQNFGKEDKVMDRKAFEAFKLFYKDQSKYPLLASLYNTAYDLNGTGLSQFNYTPYMLLAKQYYQYRPEEFSADQVLEVHGRISSAIDYQMKNGGNTDKLRSDQDKIDAFLSSLDGILSCDFIENNLVPKIKEDPTDLGTAKKIFKYSLQAKCADKPYFLEAGGIVYTNDPTYNLAKALGDKHRGNGEYDKSLEYYNEAIDMAESGDEKHETYMSLADIYSKKGLKTKSREMAYQALSIRPDSKEAYNLIGNLYFTSFEDCREGESKVTDRGIFLIAYDMYEKAGNQEQMQATKSQFPSIEEIFNENMEVGENLTVGCWINKTTKIRRRD